MNCQSYCPQTRRARRYSAPSAWSDPELEQLLEGLDTETGTSPPVGFNRGSTEFIRWVQQTLNQALGLGLAVDGIMGPQTRSAIRTFQQRNGLAVDGIVGPATEQVLRLLAGGSSPATASTCPPAQVPVDCPLPGTPFATLDNFVFDRSGLNPVLHPPIIERIASTIVLRDGGSSQVHTILIAGHTDVVGNVDYNFRLGRQRAEAVLNELCRVLNGKRPGITGRLTFQLTTCGERQPKSTAEASRRVEVFLQPSASSPSDPGLQPCLDECERQFQRSLGTAPLADCMRRRRSCQKDCEGRPA